MEKLTSYKGDVALKSMLLTEVKKHRLNDEIVQGTYGRQEGNKFKACAVGCAVHSLNKKLGKDYKTNDHSVYEKELGIPEWLARLEDTIFEGLPVKESKLWPEKFLKAIPVGKNLEPIKWKFCAYLMHENIKRVLSLKIPDDLKKQVVDAIRQVLAVHTDAIKTGEWNESAAESAAESSESAAESARSAARSARSAARSAESAARSARSAARSAESAAESAESAAESSESARSAYKKHASHLIKLLKELK